MTTNSKRSLALSAVALLVGLGWLARIDSRRSETIARIAPDAAAATEAPDASAPGARAVERESIAPSADTAEASAARGACAGRVVEELDGSPIPNAEIQLATNALEVLARATSDAEGRFRFAELDRARRELRVVARAKGHLRVALGLDGSDDELVLRLPLEVELHGRVLDAESHGPLAGASLWNGDEAHARSAADGSYRLGGYGTDRGARLYARCEGYVAREIVLRIAAGGSRELDVELQRGRSLTIRVVDARSGTSLAGVEVRPNRWEPAFARTDAEGRFTVRVAPDHEAAAWLTPEGYAEATWIWNETSIADQELAGEHRLPLRKIAWIEGRVVDEGGAPVERCHVDQEALGEVGLPRVMSLEELRRCALPGWVAYGDVMGTGSARTDARGEYRLRAVACEASIALHFMHPDYVWQRSPPIQLHELGGTLRADAVLESGATLRGRVLFNGAPWAGRVVCDLDGESVGGAFIDADGRYELLHVRPGAVRVSVSNLVGPRPGREAHVQLAAGEVRELDFAWEEERSPIRGRVLDADGAPLAGVQVSARRLDPRGGVSYERAESGEDGRYELLVALGAPYTIDATLDSVRCSRAGVAPGSEGIELVLEREGRLVLLLVDAATRRPVRVTRPELGHVSYRAARGDPFSFFAPPGGMALVDLDGRAELTLPVGHYDLRLDFERDGYCAKELCDVDVPVSDASTPRVVELERGFDLELHFVSSASGEPLAPTASILFLRAESARDAQGAPNLRPTDDGYSSRELRADGRGVAVVRGLPPGRYAVHGSPESFDFEPATIELGDEPRAVRELRWSRR